jgi:hypothetical protein
MLCNIQKSRYINNLPKLRVTIGVADLEPIAYPKGGGDSNSYAAFQDFSDRL